MAEAVLGFMAENLVSLIRNEFGDLFGVDQKIEELSSTLALSNALIEDAEQKQITERSINVGLQRLKHAVSELEPVLAECFTRSDQLRGPASLYPVNLFYRYRVGKKLTGFKRKFDEIAEDGNKFGLLVGVRERPIGTAEWRETSSLIDQSQVHGRDEDQKKILEFLRSPDRDSDSLSVYPIVGVGGVGKTTLIQLVFNDKSVKSHFEQNLIWVCVSEDFTVRRILCSIIESLIGKRYNLLDLDPMQRKVQELLRGKKYLLVLDDVWKKNHDFGFQHVWDKLQSVLKCGSKGSSILVSTRDMDVASIMGTCPAAHRLSVLSDDDCWLLFKQRAFGPHKKEHAELIAIGKQIVTKCGGLPLAAKAVGSALRTKQGKKEWLEVNESKLWTLQGQDSIFAALRLSYFNLTPTSRRCFGFCAIFPKDTEIHKEDLIHLWMANGFISSRENLEVEDVGNAVWNELHQKSFFQDIKTSDLGEICFMMHDLILDLAQSMMGQECWIWENNANMTNLSSVRHVGFAGDVVFSEKALKKAEFLQTFVMVDDHGTRIIGGLPKSQSLRALSTNFLELSSLRNFIHLRYLKLRNLSIQSFPDSIYDLRKLEILKLEHLNSLRSLPERLTCLQNLRHFYIIGCGSLSRMSPNIGKFSCLRTLSVYIVNLEIGHSLAELRDLKLGGSLSIEGLSNVGNLSEGEGANLKAKEDLQYLRLSWGYKGEGRVSATNAKQVLEALQPHPDLKGLEICHYHERCFPSWMRNDSVLASLVQLKFYNCKDCRQLSGLGKLPSLRQLEIFYMDYMQFLDDGSYDGVEVEVFKSLETLHLFRLPELESLLDVSSEKFTRKMFPRLSKLIINGCPKLWLPCLPSVEELRVIGCKSELVRSVSSLTTLTFLRLSDNEDLASLPEGMMGNLTRLKTLNISCFKILKELPREIMSLQHLNVRECDELESFPEPDFQCTPSLRTLRINSCKGLRPLPEGVRRLPSLELLEIKSCPNI